jgi:CDGSH-type Zn-finger protein
MSQPKIAGKAPLPVNLEAGKSYAWCTCGESSNQPLCDGSHKGGPFVPKVFKAEETKTAYLCTCKQTNNPGFCDGSHKNL